MEFEEFKEKFEDEDSWNYGYGLLAKYMLGRDIYLFLRVRDLNQEEYQYELVAGAIIRDGELTIGKYNTLREAYEALKEICKLNNVEM